MPLSSSYIEDSNRIKIKSVTIYPFLFPCSAALVRLYRYQIAIKRGKPALHPHDSGYKNRIFPQESPEKYAICVIKSQISAKIPPKSTIKSTFYLVCIIYIDMQDIVYFMQPVIHGGISPDRSILVSFVKLSKPLCILHNEGIRGD